jgi:protein-disulfide isomerase
MRREAVILGVIGVAVVAAAVVGAGLYRESVQSERVTASGRSDAPGDAPEHLVRPDSPTLGPGNAPVTVVEFLDPECESCAAFSPVMKRILSDYDGKVRLVVRYMPLHPNSLFAATFTEAAGEQGKYWEAQELLFRKQPEWGTKHGHAADEQVPVGPLFERYAIELGLDRKELSGAFAENRYASKVERDFRDGQALGVRQTPTMFVNGRRLARLGEADLRALIDEELQR